MRAAFRVDASVAIGTGHLRRCLSLAAALRARGDRIAFITRDLGLDPAPSLAGAGVEQAATLPRPAVSAAVAGGAHAQWAGVAQEQDAGDSVSALEAWRPDWVIVDHYAFDAGWHDRVRDALGCRIVAIDDLGDRPLAAEIVVDHNMAVDHEAKHARSRERRQRLLGGPRYALLDAVYRDARRYEFREEVGSVGIFMGGVDEIGASEKALEACREAGFAGFVEIATTAASPHLASLRDKARADGAAELILDQPDLAAFFARHDIQIGAGGGATWERFCIGAPTIAAPCAENQLAVLRPLEEHHVLIVGDVENLAPPIERMIGSADLRRSCAANARALVDGLGCDRVAEEIHAL